MNMVRRLFKKLGFSTTDRAMFDLQNFECYRRFRRSGLSHKGAIDALDQLWLNQNPNRDKNGYELRSE